MKIYDVRDYGAVGDGKTFCTEAIQKAIDVCASEGGGRVLIENGVYLSGSLTLGSFVELHIEANATLLASPDCGDYPEKTGLKHVDTSKLPRYRNASFIFAEECEYVSITGRGKIDCNGAAFVRLRENYDGGWRYDRIDAPTPPRTVFFTGCRFVTLSDWTMVNQAAGWSVWIHDCDYVTCDRLNLLSNLDYPNNDGLHINSSRDVNVSNCNIVSGDDSLIVRANNSSLAENKVCERITVTNCNLTSYCDAIRIGFLNDGTVRNCTFSNLTITDTTVGILIQAPGHGDDEKWADEGREESVTENLTFSNIVMDKMYSCPIMIQLFPDKITHIKDIRKLYFSNIHARGLTFPMFQGRPDYRLKEIVLDNCSFERVSADKLPDPQNHGAAKWATPDPNKIFEYCDNVLFNNTTFTSEN